MYQSANKLATVDDALAFLKKAGAPPRLLKHGELVAEVAGELADAVEKLGVPVNRTDVVVGAVLHDAGKIVCTAELTGRGREHEVAGEPFLLKLGVPVNLARFCRTHALAAADMPTIEDLIVAISDQLWRGAHNEGLELVLIDRIASSLGVGRWDVFSQLDDLFEQLAADGEMRLARQGEA